MYNNEVTYNEKWNTPENRAALKKLRRKYFAHSECAPDCPVAWAPEVLELFDTLERELGFIYNTSTMRGFFIQENVFSWFVVRPWANLLDALTPEQLKAAAMTYDLKTGMRRKATVVECISYICGQVLYPIRYGLKAVRVKHVNPILNRVYRKRISLVQMKEKYGELRVYFSCPSAFEQFVENEIRKCEIKLAMKGAYYPVESFWDREVSFSTGSEYYPDVYSVKEYGIGKDKSMYVSKTAYRNIMREMGLDLEEIRKRAEEKKESLSDGR